MSLLAYHHALLAAASLAPAVRPAYTLPGVLGPAASALTVTVPGLADADVVTVVLKVSKPALAEALYMLFGIVDSEAAGYTDLAYAGRQFATPAGVSENTYGSGFTGSTDLTILDNGATVTLTAKLYQRQQSSQFALYANGTQQPLGSFDGQLNRAFSNTLVIGDTQGYRWPGTIYAFKLYLADLSDPQRLQAEASL